MILLSAAESRELDLLSQRKYGIPSYSLMLNAGDAVARAIARHYRAATRMGALIVAGKGNNGGDGFVAARRLTEMGGRVRAILLARADDLRGDAARAYQDYINGGGPVAEAVSEDAFAAEFVRERPAVIVDAIFGRGLNAEVRGLARYAIEAINVAGTPAVAVDIASGINSDTGAVMGVAVRAALTVTFGYAKYGHASYPGAEFCGELEIAEIGFAPAAVAEIAPRGRLLDRADIAPLIHRRDPNTHKGTYGHPLIIAGGRGKGGAAILVSRGALRMGAGLVTAAIPECIASIVASGQAELMTEPMPDRDGHLDASGAIESLRPLIAGKSALVAGPGLGVSEDTTRLVEWLVREGAEPKRPLLLDADALNSLALIGPAILKTARGATVLTPHPGEMARLLKSETSVINANRIDAARRLAEMTGAVVLLKGARSVIAGPDGAVCVNSSGNPGMATPGMGDVLSGIVGALLGQGMNPADALKLGVFLHGEAADHLAARIGPAGYLAGEVADELPFLATP